MNRRMSYKKMTTAYNRSVAYKYSVWMDQKDGVFDQWKNKNVQDKCAQWRLLVSGGLKTDDNMLMWFYRLACHMEELSRECIHMIEDKIRTMDDRRYIDQFLHLEQALQTHNSGCKQVRQSIFYNKIYSTCIYRFDLEGEGDAMFSAFFSSWVSGMYYVWRYCKTTGFMETFLNDGVDICLGDIDQWEVICSDEDVEVLAHPSLPHPSDFLTRKKVVGDRYVDRARFEYFFQGSLQKYSVVLSRTPSVIPKLTMPPPSMEEKDSPMLEDTGVGQCLFHEGTSSHRMGVKKRRKALSRILKETRKKKKKNWRVEKHQMDHGEQDSHYDDDMFPDTSSCFEQQPPKTRHTYYFVDDDYYYDWFYD